MAGPYASIHHLFHDHYSGGVKITEWAEQLHLNARLMLERTAILPNLSRAYLLRDVLDGIMAGHSDDESTQSRLFGIFALLTDCYAPIADDLLIISALEIHAKAKLLKSGYVIHEINKPQPLRKQQKKQPVHVWTIRAAIKRGDAIAFARTTIGIGTLLESRYVRHYPIPAGPAVALEKVRRRRNMIHFAEPHSWTVDSNLLQLVDHLNRAIPALPKRMRSVAQARRRLTPR